MAAAGVEARRFVGGDVGDGDGGRVLTKTWPCSGCSLVGRLVSCFVFLASSSKPWHSKRLL